MELREALAYFKQGRNVVMLEQSLWHNGKDKMERLRLEMNI